MSCLVCKAVRVNSNNNWGFGGWGWGGFGGWGWGGFGRFGGFGGGNQVSTSVEGMLFIDLVDAKEAVKQTVARAKTAATRTRKKK